jgi:electron transfer flavoprotein beta subunit
MKIAVVVRQVPDLIEDLVIADSETSLDFDEVSFVVNETDEHALEQALLLKEAGGGEVTAVAIDFGEVDDTLYTAVAKGADQVVKIAYDEDEPPTQAQAAAMYAEAIKDLSPDLVLIGTYTHDELDGILAPQVALKLGLPYVGVVRGAKATEAGSVTAFKEFPGAVMSEMNVKLPAVLGILAADQPPRYVPVSRIRAAMKSAEFEEKEVAAAEAEAAVKVVRMYPPEKGERAEMLEGSEEEVAARIAEILVEKGILK